MAHDQWRWKTHNLKGAIRRPHLTLGIFEQISKRCPGIQRNSIASALVVELGNVVQQNEAASLGCDIVKSTVSERAGQQTAIKQVFGTLKLIYPAADLFLYRFDYRIKKAFSPSSACLACTK